MNRTWTGLVVASHVLSMIFVIVSAVQHKPLSITAVIAVVASLVGGATARWSEGA